MIADLHAWLAYQFNRTCDCCGDLRPTTEPPGLKYCAACYETEVAQHGPCLPRERILNSCLMLRDPTLHGRPLPPFRPREVGCVPIAGTGHGHLLALSYWTGGRAAITAATRSVGSHAAEWPVRLVAPHSWQV